MYEAVGASDVFGHPSAFLPKRAAPGVITSVALAGALHSFSLTHWEVPTNRSFTPTHLVHTLGRRSDWHVAGRVDGLIECMGARRDGRRDARRGGRRLGGGVAGGGASGNGEAGDDEGGEVGGEEEGVCSDEDEILGAEGVAMVAVASGLGLWTAITSDGSALVCIFPCLRLRRVHSPSFSAGLVAAAVGNLSLLALTSDGLLYEANAVRPERRARRTEHSRRAERSRRTERAVHVPQLGWLQTVGGSLEGQRTVHVAASSRAAVAVTRDGAVHIWNLGPYLEVDGRTDDCEGNSAGQCTRVSLHSSIPRPLALRDQGNGKGEKDNGKHDEGKGTEEEESLSVIVVSAAVRAMHFARP